MEWLYYALTLSPILVWFYLGKIGYSLLSLYSFCKCLKFVKIFLSTWNIVAHHKYSHDCSDSLVLLQQSEEVGGEGRIIIRDLLTGELWKYNFAKIQTKPLTFPALTYEGLLVFSPKIKILFTEIFFKCFILVIFNSAGRQDG